MTSDKEELFMSLVTTLLEVSLERVCPSNNIHESDSISLFYKHLHLPINNIFTFRRKMTENKKTDLGLRCRHSQFLCHGNSAVPMLRQ